MQSSPSSHWDVTTNADSIDVLFRSTAWCHTALPAADVANGSLANVGNIPLTRGQVGFVRMLLHRRHRCFTTHTAAHHCTKKLLSRVHDTATHAAGERKSLDIGSEIRLGPMLLSLQI